MKTSVAYKAIKNMVFSVIVLLPLQLNTGIVANNPFDTTINDTTQVADEVPPSASPKVVLLDLERKYCNTECFLKSKEDTFKFMSKTFGIKYSLIYEDLVMINDEKEYDEHNIGQLKNKNGEIRTFGSFEEGLIEYLFAFSKKNPKLVSNTRVPYTGNSEYVINLIKYFTSIYTNVDYLTAVSIGASESGHYKVDYMLRCNNIYGGMGKNGLIKYRNIEYGVLSYIRLLSKNYYGKGLNTIESIGRVYCPVFDANGNKTASPHWIKLVKSAKNRYAGTYTDVTVELLLND